MHLDIIWAQIRIIWEWLIQRNSMGLPIILQFSQKERKWRKNFLDWSKYSIVKIRNHDLGNHFLLNVNGINEPKQGMNLYFIIYCLGRKYLINDGIVFSNNLIHFFMFRINLNKPTNKWSNSYEYLNVFSHKGNILYQSVLL